MTTRPNPFDDPEVAFASPPEPEPAPTQTMSQDEAFRASHIGGSEASALVGLSPYDTPWSLFMKKSGKIAPADFSNLGPRQRWGLNLEKAIIAEAADQTGYDLRRWTRAPLSNGTLGGHPDGRRVVNNRTRAIVECKGMDWLVFRDAGEAPLDHQVIQLQTYMGLAGVDQGFLCVLVGGNDLRIFEYEFRPKLFLLLQRKATEMWERVHRNDPPPVNYEADVDAINEVFRGARMQETIDLTGDNELTDAIVTYVEQSTIEKAAREAKAAAAAEIKLKGGVADRLICGDWQVKFSTSEATPDRRITADMVGQIIPGTKASRSINPPRQRKGA